MWTLLVGLSLGQVLGTGRDGALTVGNMDTVVNAHSPVTAFTSGTDTAQVLDPADFPVGTLVLLHQTQVAVASPRNVAQFDVVTSHLGLFELARVVTVAGDRLTFDHVLAQAFSAPGLQAVRVPEYTTVSVGPAASLVAPAWNGRSGGILALLVQGGLTNAGFISASQKGFRGGLARLSLLNLGCTDGAEDPLTGEGLSTTPAPMGSGNLVNGGGAGSCSDNGGGGGGSIGRGGQGGRFTDPTPRGTGGQGGAPLLAAVEGRLLFGGGGGGGRGNISSQTATDGAAGGGVIYLRARLISGTGLFLSAGGAAGEAFGNGAGGGGAGGTLDIGSTGLLECSVADASGSSGGSTSLEHGPGGGGGGGRIRLRGSPVNCTSSVLAGLAGVTLPPDAGSATEAQPSRADATGYTGDSQVRAPLLDDSDAGVLFTDAGVPLTDAGVVPTAVLTVTQPAPDETVFTATPCPYGGAPPGARVSASIDGKDLGTVAPLGTAQWTLCTPAGVTLLNGDHTLVATAVDSAGASLGRVEVRFKVRDPNLAVGCGCGAAQGVGLAALLLLAGFSGLRRRRPS